MPPTLPPAPGDPLVSVIIPTLQEESCLGQTLETLLAAHGHFEVIVADGESTDRTHAIARRYCRTITVPGGRAAQMNRGAAEARGELLLFLYADRLFSALGIHFVQ